MAPRRRSTCVALSAFVALLAAATAYGFIDPDRPASWLVGESKVVAELKIAAVEKNSATFAVVRVLKGAFAPGRITVRWTDIQQPPVEAKCVGAPAVLLVPKDDEDPTLVQLSPEYLSLKPDPAKAGDYELLRLNGFVKGSFNGESADFIRLIDDILAGRAWFPVWADTGFAPARKVGDLPDTARALVVGDLEGGGALDIVASTPRGLVAFAPDGKGGFAPHPLKGIGPADALQLTDVDGDGRCDILTSAGLFRNRGDWQFAPADGLKGRTWSAACFCSIPGRPAPAVAAIEAGRAKLFARDVRGAWADVTAETGLDAAPANVVALGTCLASDRLEILLLSPDALTCLEARPGRRLAVIQSIAMNAKAGARIAQRDMDGDGIPDAFVAADGVATFFRRLDDGTLAELHDYLGDVRKMFQGIEGAGALIAEDLNNDGRVDLLVASKSKKLSLVMNRGYHNLCEGTENFDLPFALKDLEAIQAAAAADVDGDGDVDLIVASGKGLYVLSNTFESKPKEANDRPRNALLTVRAPGKFAALVTLEDKDGKLLASQRDGEGPVADTLYFGRLGPAPAIVALTTADGRTIRRAVEPGKPVVFR